MPIPFQPKESSPGCREGKQSRLPPPHLNRTLRQQQMQNGGYTTSSFMWTFQSNSPGLNTLLPSLLHAPVSLMPWKHPSELQERHENHLKLSKPQTAHYITTRIKKKLARSSQTSYFTWQVPCTYKVPLLGPCKYNFTI